MRGWRFILALLALGLWGGISVHAADTGPAPETLAASDNADDGRAVDFAAPAAVLDLGPSLMARKVSEATDPDGAWFTIAVRNPTNADIARVLAAADSPTYALALQPGSHRPALIEAAVSDTDVVIERTAAYGANAIRVSVPPGHAATLALHFEGIHERPVVLAWTEPALIAHNRQAGLLQGLVAGLLAAAAAFAAGAAVLSGRILARWAALFLGCILFAELTAAGGFDDNWLATFGGPSGLFALALAVAVAAGIRLVDYVAAFEAFHRGASVWRDRAALAMIVTGVAAFAGLPAAGLIVRIAALIAAAAGAGYLTHCGRLGISGARRLAPAAAVFALVTAAAAFNALGFFGINLIAPGAIGGFSAAGALLVGLAAALPIDPAIARLRELREAHRHDDVQATITDEAYDRVREIAAVAASHQGVFDLDLETGLLSLSSEAAALIGLPAGAVELSRETWLARIHPDDREVYEEAFTTYRRDPGIAFRLEFRVRAAGGRMAWFELRATMTGQATEAERCLGLIADVTARKAAEDAEHPEKDRDGLTGLHRRAALLNAFAGREGDRTQAALVLFDLDRFKPVNESLGRDGGDAALAAVGERLSHGFSAECEDGRVALYRAGGDMFAVLGFGVVDLAAFGQRVLQLMRLPFHIGEREIYLAASAGVAAGADAGSMPELIAAAERAMVEAKRGGGGRVSVYSAQTTARAGRDSVALETDLRRALERDEIGIHYQPIVRLSDRGLAGFEALLRWTHPERGIVPPAQFIPHAEHTGLIVPLGRLALWRAAEDLAHWRQKFPGRPLFVSVNVAWRQIAEEEFSRELASLLHAGRLAKGTLKLEITESAVMAGAARAEATLRRLKALGAGLSIDDFGTGHSSLSRLRRLPFDTIKIDKSFLAAAHEKAGSAILESIVSLAHELKLAIVAEGVETEEDVQRLKRLGCHYAQGYLFGRAIPASEAESLLTQAAV
jgi:diguanylate cyclase (GGDEF)-like protein/PAS domain S-box-containing protein